MSTSTQEKTGMNPRHAAARAQTMTEYTLILAGLALVAYGLSPTSGYNFLDDAINALIGKVVSLL
jgi:hypothetical protein